jgi:hypothetical protein
MYVDVPDVTPENLLNGVFFGFGNVPIPEGFALVRLLSVSLDVFPSVTGAVANKQASFVLRYNETTVGEYQALTYQSPLNSSALSFVATAFGSDLSISGFHYLYDDTSDTQPVRSGLTPLQVAVPWASWSLGVVLNGASASVGIRVVYTAEFRSLLP